MTVYESIYKGATFLLDPNYQYTGYRVPTGSLGGTTSIQTANQLKEVNNLLNQGMKNTEISVINPEVFEMIPKEQFKEINRLNKLTGAESTLHAPTLDPSGFGEQGWSEEQRQAVERQFTEFVKRSHDLDPKGNIPVTIHASVIPGSEIIPEKDKEGQYKFGRIIAVDTESGKPVPMEREKRYYPTHPEELGTGKQGRTYEPEEELEIANTSYWDNQLSQVIYYKERGDEILRNNLPLIQGANPEELTPEQKAAQQMVNNGQIYLKNTMQSLSGLFNQAYKSSNPETQEALKKASENFKETFDKYQKNPANVGLFSGALQNLIDNMRVITDPPRELEAKGIQTPHKYVPIEEFAKDKASETLSTVALKNYKEFGSTSPIISIENPPYGQAFASGDDLKKLVEETRKKFTEKLVAEGKSKSEAEKTAEKLIGATWDTSHIAMIRKQGFKNEMITEQTKAIAPFIKHVHFNDNFGSTHTDLPPGMGSVPIKDILEVLEKNKVKGKRIFEGGNFFQHFQKSPFPYTLSWSGSPMYSENGGPYFNQMGGLGAYYMGQGPINPAVHHSVYGAGFTTLPVELGGEMQGQQSRFSGAPNQ